ncbi:glycoside hydrolase family 3 N-terminal domain-containing protein, partial [Acinetobacter baumannii]
FWIQEVLRNRLKFNGVLFSDDLSMQAACVAGGADARIQAALAAGCDMGLVCNDRSAACTALDGITNLELPNQERLERMRGRIPQIQVGETLSLGNDWQAVKTAIEEFKNSI